MLPTMCRGSAAMMDGGGEVYCPRISGGCQKKSKTWCCQSLKGVRTRQPTKIRA